MPLAMKLTVVLFPTLTVPVCTTVDAPFGPVIVQLTLLICSPPGRVNCIPTEPTPSAGGDDCGPSTLSGTLPPGETVPGEEQPTCAPPMAAALAAPRRSAFRMSVVLAFDLMGGAPKKWGRERNVLT
jgi:hypothetical protein